MEPVLVNATCVNSGSSISGVKVEHFNAPNHAVRTPTYIHELPPRMAPQTSAAFGSGCLRKWAW